jgi:hypothetical protein
MRFGWILAAAFVSVACCGPGRAQDYLIVPNETNAPIQVFIKANGPLSDNRKWQSPVTVDPGQEGKIPLHGWQPFDIDIRQADGSDRLLDDVCLFYMMDQCVANGKKEWTINTTAEPPAECGYRVDACGRRVYEECASKQTGYRATAGNNFVRIPYGYNAGFDPPHDPPVLPGQRPHRVSP